MNNISVADWIQIGTVASGIIVALFGVFNRWAVANHRDNLAMFTSAASNAAARVNTIVASLPPNTDAAAAKAALINQSAMAILEEFGKQARSINATPLKTTALIEGQYGQLPNQALVGDADNALNVSKLVTALHADSSRDVVIIPKGTPPNA